MQVLRAAQRNGTRAERIRAATAILDFARRLDGSGDDYSTVRGRREPQTASRILPRNLIIVGGTEEEYLAALKQLRWSNGDFDADDSPEEIDSWRAEQGGLPAAPQPESDRGGKAP